MTFTDLSDISKLTAAVAHFEGRSFTYRGIAGLLACSISSARNFVQAHLETGVFRITERRSRRDAEDRYCVDLQRLDDRYGMRSDLPPTLRKLIDAAAADRASTNQSRAAATPAVHACATRQPAVMAGTPDLSGIGR